MEFNLLGRKNYRISDKITVHIPLVGELEKPETESEYMKLISVFVNTPCDMMAELDDCGIDYTQISEYDLFEMLFSALIHSGKLLKWKLLFEKPDFDEIIINPEIIMNQETYFRISNLIRRIFFMEKNMQYYNVPEPETRKYIISRQRQKNKRMALHKKDNGFLDRIILMLVNNRNFKYNFESVSKISVYDLYASFRQIFKNIEVDGLMNGYYAGNIDISKVSSDALNRFIL